MMKAIGFINPNNYYPSPLITVAAFENNYFSIFPDGELYPIDNHNLPEIEKMPGFTPQPTPLEIKEGEFAFGVNVGEIFISDPLRINGDMIKLLSREDLPEKSKILIKEFLKNILEGKSNPPIKTDLKYNS